MEFRRRDLMLSLAAGALAGSAGAANAGAVRRSRELPRMRPVVLVHGAWHGGWCWRDVAARLREAGTPVFAPTLTGLGERAHLRMPVPTLATHVADVIGVLDAEELHDVVLVGHSYGGMVVTGVCDAAADRIAHAVFLDAALPTDGQSMVTQMPGITAAQADAARDQLVQLAGGGDWLPPYPADALGVPASRADLRPWIDRRLTPQPLPTWLEPLRLRNGGAERLPRTYVACTSPPLTGSAMPLHAARVRNGELGPAWRYREIATGHEAMITEPARVAELIAEAAMA